MRKIKVIVKKRFLDGSTGLYRKPGDEMTISEKRYLEIIRKDGSLVEVAKNVAAEAKKATTEIKK